MNQYITGQTIKLLREKSHMTQAVLADKLNISDKTVSKWETGAGYPDISLIEPIATAFNISVLELFSGNTVENKNKSSNLSKSQFYVCPICGNVISSVGAAVISCHGLTLPPLSAEKPDDFHGASVEFVEDELYISVSHPMSKSHYISFIAAVSCNRTQIVKLYPEQDSSARFKVGLIDKILFFCNRDGLFGIDFRDLKKL